MDDAVTGQLEGLRISRRGLLGGALGIGAAAALAACGSSSSTTTTTTALSGMPSLGQLPTEQQMRANIAHMVGFGPRFTGSDAHNAFIDWSVRNLKAAGCSILPYDQQTFERWLADDWSLQVLDGPARGPVKIASYYPYGGETPAGGVVGKLVTPALVAAGKDSAAGNIMLIDTNAPADITQGQLAATLGFEYIDWPNSNWMSHNYRRMWLASGKGGNTGGAVAAIYILDGSFAACAGNYAPFGEAYQNFPALYVDQATGAALTSAAAGLPSVRLVMTASKKTVSSPSVVAVLEGDGSTDEVLILNTHSDGPNFAEENGVVALVMLARYFAGLPKSKRLHRSLAFSAVTGHFGPVLPQTQGFVNDHPDLIDRAAAAVTIEHFGSTEWWDDAQGYHATGRPEITVVYNAKTSSVENTVIDTIKSHNLLQTGAAPAGPEYFGVGGPIQNAGVPEASFIAGPTYLVSTGMSSPTSPYAGELDKLDPALAARQVAWAADVLTQFDGMSKAELAGQVAGA